MNSVRESTPYDVDMGNTQHKDYGRYNVLIQNVVRGVILGDYRSDFNGMPIAPFKKVT